MQRYVKQRLTLSLSLHKDKFATAINNLDKLQEEVTQLEYFTNALDPAVWEENGMPLKLLCSVACNQHGTVVELWDAVLEEAEPMSDLIEVTMMGVERMEGSEQEFVTRMLVDDDDSDNSEAEMGAL